MALQHGVKKCTTHNDAFDDSLRALKCTTRFLMYEHTHNPVEFTKESLRKNIFGFRYVNRASSHGPTEIMRNAASVHGKRTLINMESTTVSRLDNVTNAEDAIVKGTE